MPTSTLRVGPAGPDGTVVEETIESRVPRPMLGRGGRLTAIGIAAIGIVLLTASALDIPLGLPTFICGAVTAAAVLAFSRQSPWPVINGISWSVLPLVAGLFVMVEALVKTGLPGMGYVRYDENAPWPESLQTKAANPQNLWTATGSKNSN